jgi:excisionase family DNA binding protein
MLSKTNSMKETIESRERVGNGPDLSPSGSPAAPDYETRRQVAHRLGVSERTIGNMMRARRIPFIRLTPKLIRFPRAEVDSYLAAHYRVNSSTEV